MRPAIIVGRAGTGVAEHQALLLACNVDVSGKMSVRPSAAPTRAEDQDQHRHDHERIGPRKAAERFNRYLLPVNSIAVA